MKSTISLAVILIFLLFLHVQAFSQILPQPTQERLIKVQTFLVSKIDVVGSTVLTQGEIKGIVSPYENRNLDLAALKQVAEKITALYHQKGFTVAVAFVPPQEVVNGVVKILVLEGRVGQIIIQGNKAYSESFIRYYLAPTIVKGILQFDKFEKALYLLGEFKNLYLEYSLLPEEGQEGVTDLLIQVKDSSPTSLTLNYNNFQNIQVGRDNVGAEFLHGNLTGRGDLLDLNDIAYFSSGPAGNKINQSAALLYSVPITPNATKLSVSYSTGGFVAGQSVSVLNVRANEQDFGLATSLPLARSATQSTNLQAAFFYKNGNNFLFGSSLTALDRIRELTLSYNTLTLSPESQTFFNLAATQGLGTILGGMQPSDPLASRVGAGDNFTKVNLDLWSINRIFSKRYFVLRAGGQFASGPLPVIEQYSIGGADSVRGYQLAEALGDAGWTISGEFRIPMDRLEKLQAEFFMDAGSESLFNPQAGEFSVRTLVGGGFGLRFSPDAKTLFRLEVGFPMAPTLNSTGENPMVYGQVLKQF